MTGEITARAHREGRWRVFQLDGLGRVGPTGAPIPAMGQSRSAVIPRSAQLRREAARSFTGAHQLSRADTARALHISPQRMSRLIAKSA
ncbi:hypothetical protein HQQ80_15465 [Microbacteriaceae bacterium VKM Ac-2855]|nr:hypothetical protein [Microbacteriaceae bacterium VKM Ac-2855]